MGASEQASGLDRSPQRPHDVSLVSVGRDMAASEQACGLDKESAAASRHVPGVCWPRHGRPRNRLVVWIRSPQRPHDVSLVFAGVCRGTGGHNGHV